MYNVLDYWKPCPLYDKSRRFMEAREAILNCNRDIGGNDLTVYNIAREGELRGKYIPPYGLRLECVMCRLVQTSMRPGGVLFHGGGVEIGITPRLRRGRVIGPVCGCGCLSVTKNFENSCKRAI